MKQFLKYVFASMFGFLLAQGFLVFLTIFITTLVIGFSVSQKSVQNIKIEPEQDKILRINLNGSVVERLKFEEIMLGEELPFLDNQQIGLFEFEQALEKASKDEKVKGLYVRVGALNTVWASLTSMRNAIKEFKAKGKFVYFYGNSYNEATYYLATVADSIFMYPEGDFELNGFATVMGFLKGSLEKLEVQPEIFRAGSYKSAVETFLREDMSEENREQIQALNNDLWAVFTKAVSQTRKVNTEEINKISNGLLASNSVEAKKYKLVDQLKYEDEVLDFLKGVVEPDEKDRLPFISLNRYLLSKRNKSNLKKSFISIDFANSDGDDKGAKVAVLFAQGEMHIGESDEGSIGSETFVQALREIRKNDNVKAVVLRINSPGGQSLAADEIWREVVLTNKVKPVIASFADIAASGGYYMAAGARKILAQPTTVTGSIGVFGMSFVTKDLFKNKLGMTFDKVVTHRSADMGLGHRAMSEAETYVIEKEIDRVYGRFLSIVEKGRKLSAEDTKSLAGGRVWSGWAASKLKLVDQMGGLKEAIEVAAVEAQLEEDQYELSIYPKEKVIFGRFLQMALRGAQSQFGFDFLNLNAILGKKNLDKEARLLKMSKGSQPLTFFPFVVEQY